VSVFTNPYSGSTEQASSYIRAVLDLVEGRDPMYVLGSTPGLVRERVEGLPIQRLHDPEREGKWSIAHVLRHLADSDLVWAWRLRMALAHERPSVGGYDQDAWADRLGYAEADPTFSLHEFEAVRRGNVWLLERATPADLERVAVHPERGEESVGHMIRLYAGHDLLHLRQIDRIRAALQL
jgi:uncharacterized damage-inducible protein DinB